MDRPLGFILRNADMHKDLAFEIVRSVFAKHVGNILIDDIDLYYETNKSLPPNIDRYDIKKALKFDEAIFKLMMLLRNRGEKLSNLGITIDGMAAGFSDQYDKGAKGIAYLILPLNMVKKCFKCRKALPGRMGDIFDNPESVPYNCGSCRTSFCYKCFKKMKDKEPCPRCSNILKL